MKRHVLIPAVVLALLAGASGLAAQTAGGEKSYGGIIPGFRAGFFTSANGLYLAGDILTRVNSRIDFNPNVQLVLGNQETMFELSADALYNFTPRNRTLLTYVGGGLGVLFRNPKTGSNQTDVAVNGIAGVAFRTGGRFLPYLQAKLLLSGVTDFGLGIGVRF